MKISIYLLIFIVLAGCTTHQGNNDKLNDEIENIKISESTQEIKENEISPESYIESNINYTTNQETELNPELEELLKSLLTNNEKESIKLKDFKGQYYGYTNSNSEFVLNGPLECKFKYQFINEDSNYWESKELKGFIHEGKKEGDFTCSELLYDGEGDYVGVSGSSQEILTFRNDICIFIKYWEYGEGSYYSDAIENPSKGIFGYLSKVRYK